MDLISKYDLVEKIVNTNDETVLHQVQNLLGTGEAEPWEQLDSELKASLKRGLAQSAKGKLIPHREVMKRVKSRLD